MPNKAPKEVFLAVPGVIRRGGYWGGVASQANAAVAIDCTTSAALELWSHSRWWRFKSQHSTVASATTLRGRVRARIATALDI